MIAMENQLSQMLANSVVSEHVPIGRVYFINLKYFPSGDLDVEATALASVAVVNIATSEEK